MKRTHRTITTILLLALLLTVFPTNALAADSGTNQVPAMPAEASPELESEEPETQMPDDPEKTVPHDGIADLFGTDDADPAGSFRLIHDHVTVCCVVAHAVYATDEDIRILAEKLQCGCEVDMRRIPVRQEDVEICEILGKDIFRICSSGGWLAACDTAEETVARLRRAQIPAFRIGRTISGRGDYSVVYTQKGEAK